MTYTILLVDDSELIRTRLCSLLEGIDGVTAIAQVDTLAGALMSVRRSPPTLLVLDLTLPDGFGLDMIAPLKHMAPHLQIAVLTLNGSDHFRQMSRARGADWFFDKACELGQLLNLVRQQAADPSA